VKKEVITAETCVRCGLCCISPYDQDVFCDVLTKDLHRLSNSFIRRNVQTSGVFDLVVALQKGQHCPQAALKTRWREQKSGPLKDYELCMCVALRGTALVKVRCSIYDKRPDACRDAVKPGDKVCREVRRAFKEQVDEQNQ